MEHGGSKHWVAPMLGRKTTAVVNWKLPVGFHCSNTAVAVVVVVIVDLGKNWVGGV